MSLSVSSFPEAPQKLAHHPKWRKPPTPKRKSGFFGALLCKGSVPFLKHIRHFTKTDVKESVVHQPVSVNVQPTRSRHSLSIRSPSSIRASSIVVDLRSVPHNGECFPSSKIDDVDASSLDPVLEISHSPNSIPIALPFPSTTDGIPTTPTLLSVKEHNGIAPVFDDFEPHHSQYTVPSTKPPLTEASRRCRATTSPATTVPPGFETRISSILRPSTTPSTPVATESHLRSRSILTGPKQVVIETEPPHRPRYKSETSAVVRGATMPPSPNDDLGPPEGKRTYRGKSSPPPLPTSMASSALSSKQRQQERDMGPWRPLSNAAGLKPSELPVPNQQLTRLTAHMLCMRSGSRPLPTHLQSGLLATRPRSKTSDAASAPYRQRTKSASLAVRSSEGADHHHHQRLSPLPPPRVPTPGLLDAGRKSRLPVPVSPAVSRLGTTAAAIES
jgi:hypothetical protein